MRYIDRYNWESFCQQYEKTEDEMKSFLFKGKLSEKEFETLIDCSRHTFIDFVYYIDYGKLFASCPRLIECCNWTRLDELSWRVLLSQKPEFADKCNKWDEFDGNDWSMLLKNQPQFVNKCDKWDEFNGYDWSCLLAEQPQFADKCDVWDYLDADQWRSLLKNQPQFVDKCTKSSIVVNVLIIHPQFTEHCNTSIITEKGKAKLLAKHPDLVIYFPEKTETKVPEKNTPKKQIKNKLAEKKVDNNQPELF